MAYFKIKNITTELSKRHAKANTAQVVTITDNFKTEKITINPDSEILLEANFLPISLHKLRTAGVISIVELDKNTYQKLVGEQPKAAVADAPQSQPSEGDETTEEKNKKNGPKFSKRDK